MQRYGTGAQHAAIEGALRTMPAGIRERIGTVDFLCADPVFTGFVPLEQALHHDGRRRSETSFVRYAYAQTNLPRDQRRTTIVLPPDDPEGSDIWVVWHELAHVLHGRTGWLRSVKPTTPYATRDWYEAFAEAFCAWRHPRYCGRDLREVDPRAHAFFESLAAPR